MFTKRRSGWRTAARYAAALAASATLLMALAVSPSGASVRPAAQKLSWRQALNQNLSLMSATSFPAKSQLRVAAEPGPTTWTHNISGLAKGWWTLGVTGYGQDKAIWPLKYAIAAQPNLPVSIGIQEACKSQASDLLGWLKANKSPHYEMHFYQQNTCRVNVGGRTVTSPYGIAVFAIGDRGHEGLPFDSQVENDESRGWACIRSVYPYTACTSHMTYVGGDNGNSAPQFMEMWNIVKSIKAARPTEDVYWGGDFYMTPLGISLRFPFGGFFGDHPEGDICPGGGYQNTVQNGNGTRKVDYVFKTKPANCSRDAVVHLDTYYSDHALLGGYL